MHLVDPVFETRENPELQTIAIRILLCSNAMSVLLQFTRRALAVQQTICLETKQ